MRREGSPSHVGRLRRPTVLGSKESSEAQQITGLDRLVQSRSAPRPSLFDAMHGELSPQQTDVEAGKADSGRIIVLRVAGTQEASWRNIAPWCGRRAEDVTVKQRLSVT